MSEQRRPLLLPQEVKALGTEQALIFYEGLPPIRCRKIRYFADARFRARLMPPPVVAPAPIEAPRPIAEGPLEESAPKGAEGKVGVAGEPVFREATVEDLERLDSLTLDDFEAPLGEIEIPEKADGERLTTEEMNTAVEQFLQSLQRQEGP